MGDPQNVGFLRPPKEAQGSLQEIPDPPEEIPGPSDRKNRNKRIAEFQALGFEGVPGPQITFLGFPTIISLYKSLKR